MDNTTDIIAGILLAAVIIGVGFAFWVMTDHVINKDK